MRPYWQSSRQVTEGLPLYGGTENKGNERVSPSTRPCLSAAVKLPTPRRLPSAPNKLPEAASRKAARAVAVETFEHPLPPPSRHTYGLSQSECRKRRESVTPPKRRTLRLDSIRVINRNTFKKMTQKTYLFTAGVSKLFVCEGSLKG